MSVEMRKSCDEVDILDSKSTRVLSIQQFCGGKSLDKHRFNTTPFTSPSTDPCFVAAGPGAFKCTKLYVYYETPLPHTSSPRAGPGSTVTPTD